MHIHWEVDSEVSLPSSLNELEAILLFFWEVAKCQSYSVFWKKKKKIYLNLFCYSYSTLYKHLYSYWNACETECPNGSL